MLSVISADRGSVYATGSNVNAQLGLGNQSPHVPTPARVCHCCHLLHFIFMYSATQLIA